MLAYHIADHSLNFFARGRGFTVGQDSIHFDLIRKMLTSQDTDLDKLIELADPRIAVQTASQGVCQVVGNTVLYDGAELHNVWVDKILAFQQHNLPFDPIMKALADLQKNPAEKARLRLPVFVEQSKLGFLDDGRIAALKAVNDNYTDCHTGSFDNSVGKVLEMPREAVDVNPDNECSSGFHLGAYDYVKNFGYQTRRIMLCAFWPRDVVAVPRDYNGQKMRVCKYEVLEEMDRTALVQFIEENQNLLRRYSEIKMPAEDRLDAAIDTLDIEDEEDEDDQDYDDQGNLLPGVDHNVGSQIVSADKSMVIDVQDKTISIKPAPKRKPAPKKAAKKKVVAKAKPKAKAKVVAKKVVAKKPAKKLAAKKPIKKVAAKKSAKKVTKRR